MTLESVIKEYQSHFPQDTQGQDLIRRAAQFAKRAHRNQKRVSGDYYFSHLIATAEKLAKWKMDSLCIAAGFLHDTIEDCDIAPTELSSLFGPEVLFLVEGVTKLGTLRYQEEKKVGIESLRKMILAISRDLRVIFIKLADRFHNMQTLSFLPHQKQHRIALETLEVYAPLAYRLGMQGVAGELEDLAFPYTHPKHYIWLKENVRESYEERDRYVRTIEPIVRQQIKDAGITPISIDYRAKRLYSLYRKLLRYDMNLEQIYDLVALRIIVSTIEECYLIMGVIHQLWPPMPGRIKDYIALPKSNGYRSLHTTVFCVNNKPTEFQIRTAQMHEEAEHGAAAHWLYESRKESHQRSEKHTLTRELEWVKQLKEWQNQFPGSKEFLDALKVDFFSDRIFVLTPKGRVVDLPDGATPVDFAYHVHTEIGNSCVGARVNNKIVTLDYALQSGDIVEILVQKSKKPSESWLSFVKTDYAKKKIKSAVNKKILVPKKAEFKIICRARIGLIKDITTVISRNHLPVMKMETFLNEKYPCIKIAVGTDNKEKAEHLLLKIKKINDVREISYRLID